MMGLGTRLSILLLIGLLAGWASPAPAAERERILDFRSHIEVLADGRLTVTETITVISARKAIKRGIYRAFPTTYEDRFGNTVRVGFKVLTVLKDGQPEPYHLRDASNGTNVYIGDKNVFLKPGRYTYTITYRTDRQIGFFEKFDELYWNVTGNGWAFPIERASAVVTLPAGAAILDTTAYTGAQGAKGGDYIASRDSSDRAAFTTTRSLGPRQGLTVVVSWPKGFVTQPSTVDEIHWLLSDDASLTIALAGLAALIAYYLFAWVRVGQDPEAGTIIPLFEPPEGFSPAAVRFVTQMGYDDKAFAAAVVSMAIKGYLKIDEIGDSYTLIKTGEGEDALSPGERKLGRHLFGYANTIELKNENHKKIKKALKALRNSLRIDFEKMHFRRNGVYIIPGLVVSVVTLAAVVFALRDPFGGLFMCVWLSIWTAVCYFLATRLIKVWKSGNKLAVVVSTLFVAAFFGGEIFGAAAFIDLTSPLATGLLIGIVIVNAVFYQLLKAPTLHGRRIMDHIEGFKHYLSVAEQDRMQVLNPPDKTPELFEKYLPFALALDVEHEWSENFADVLAAAGSEPGNYSPRWYSGSSWHRNGAGGLASSLGGSFSGAISSSSTAPGSSSGGGGGGFSGGGGGGGGGGGW